MVGEVITPGDIGDTPITVTAGISGIGPTGDGTPGIAILIITMDGDGDPRGDLAIGEVPRGGITPIARGMSPMEDPVAAITDRETVPMSVLPPIRAAGIVEAVPQRLHPIAVPDPPAVQEFPIAPAPLTVEVPPHPRHHDITIVTTADIAAVVVA